jgi:hypothetical protein
MDALDKIFSSQPLHPAYTEACGSDTNNNSMWDHGYRYTSIIDSPNITMSIPLIHLSIEACVGMMDKALDEQHGRRKPLLAISRGQGGGKTRCFEEIRRNFLRSKPNVLTLAITFNHRWTLTATEVEDIKTGRRCMSNTKIILYLLSHRMLSVFNGEELTSTATMLGDLHKKTSPESMFRGTIRHMIKKLNRTTIDSFVLVIDEAFMVYDILGVPEDEDLYEFVKDVMLNQPIFFHDESGNNELKVIKTCLAVSSLALSPFGYTISARSIKAFPLPSRLNSSTIVTKYWSRCFPNEQLDQETQRKLELLASSVNQLPRLVEIVGLSLNRVYAFSDLTFNFQS